jgi:hypothetical protein
MITAFLKAARVEWGELAWGIVSWGLLIYLP